MRAGLLLAPLLLAVAGVAGAQACPKPLRVAFNDTPFPPALHGTGAAFADPPGWAVLAVREAAQRLGCPVQLLRLPGRRIGLELEHNRVEFGLFFGATPALQQRMRFPTDAAGRPDPALAPLLGHMAFYALSDSPALKAWDGNALAPGWQVGVVASSSAETLARARGWPVAAASSFDTSVRALRARRFELLLTARESLPPEQLRGEEALVEVSPPVLIQPYFAAASRAQHSRHAEFTTAFWHELCVSSRRLWPEARGQDCGARPGGR